MDKLSLVNRLRQDCGVSRTPLSTLVGVSGEDARLVGYIEQAWVEIQEQMPDWEWMRKDFSFDTTEGVPSYSVATIFPVANDFGLWKNGSFRIYTKSFGVGDEIFLDHVEYGQFRDYWMWNTRRTTKGRPTAISIKPDRSLILGLVPNTVYTVVGEYFKEPSLLTEDISSPDMPTQFHMIIVYKAMSRYAMYESAPEVLGEAKEQYSYMLERIMASQMPMITHEGSFR